MIRALWKPLAIAIGLLLVLTYLLIQSASPDAVLHERTLAALHALELNDAKLKRDLLRARAGLLRHYDSLVEAVNGLYAALDTLRAGGKAAYGEVSSEIGQRLDELAVTITDTEARVDVFKSGNALLQNSLMYFTHTSQELNTPTENGQQSRAAEIGALANGMLQFMRNPYLEKTADEVTVSLNRLAQLPMVTRKIRSLIAHGRLIVDMLPNVDRGLNQLISAPTIEQTQALQTTYLRYHSSVQGRAKLFRFLLYSVAVILLAYLIYLFARLRTHARALAGQSLALQSRLRFESLITEISTQFINLPSDRVNSGIKQALETLGEYTAMDRTCFSLLSADRMRIDNLHEWRRADAISAQTDDFKQLPVPELRWIAGHLERHGYLYMPRVEALPRVVSCLRMRFQKQNIQSFLCIAIPCAGKLLGAFGFAAERAEKSWSNDDIALLRTVGEIFASALERQRAEVERDTLEAQLRQSQKLKAIGTLAGGIAHDFNNLLGAILGYGEMAVAALPGESRPRYYVQQVMTAGRRAKGVVDQILTFSRRGSNERRSLLLEPLVRETLELLRASLSASIVMHLRLEAEDATVLGDPTELHQVVMNLCTNAAQAMQGSGRLEVALDTIVNTQALALSHGTLAAGPYVRLTVRDTGAGMDEATLERIFDPFFTTKEVGGGTGLGLSMVHGIVANHGGAMNIRSKPGEGSSFEVCFPCAQGCAASETETDAPIPRGRGETIMLVDDEQPLVLLGEEILAALGYEPVGFNDSQQALKSFRANPQRFDLVLTDEVMPELTGTQLATELHQLRPGLPVILMTGYSGPILMERVHQVGIREILKKPLQARDMAESIARHLLETERDRTCKTD